MFERINLIKKFVKWYTLTFELANDISYILLEVKNELEKEIKEKEEKNKKKETKK